MKRSMNVPMPASKQQVLECIEAAFAAKGHECRITLRQGEAQDDYEEPAPETMPRDWRSVSDEDLELYPAGLSYLDDESRRFYAPAFLHYVVRHRGAPPSLALAQVLPRFPLTPPQVNAVEMALEYLAFDRNWEVADEDALAQLQSWKSYRERSQ